MIPSPKVVRVTKIGLTLPPGIDWQDEIKTMCDKCAKYVCNDRSYYDGTQGKWVIQCTDYIERDEGLFEL